MSYVINADVTFYAVFKSVDIDDSLDVNAKKEADKEITQTCPNLNNMGNWNAFIWIIITVIALVTFTLGIFLGYILCKKGVLQKLFKKKEKEEGPVEIETLSDTIDLSETLKTINDGNNKKKKGQ